MTKVRFVSAKPKSGQHDYWKALHEKTVVFISGAAGVGKTFLALNYGLQLLYDKSSSIDRICVIRPYIMSKTGERLGALPGTLDEKVAPFVASIRDSLEECVLDKQEIDRLLRHQIEYLTLSTLRGRSLHRRFILVEEAQNVPIQGDGMLTILTRIGKGSRLVIAGDLSQCDVDHNDSGFLEAANALDGIDEISLIEMENVNYIHRNSLVGPIISAFNHHRQSYLE